jgi:hypothetical protein
MTDKKTQKIADPLDPFKLKNIQSDESAALHGSDVYNTDSMDSTMRAVIDQRLDDDTGEAEKSASIEALADEEYAMKPDEEIDENEA